MLKMKLKSIRIGNIQFRAYNAAEYKYEIVQWCHNLFYGKEKEFEAKDFKTTDKSKFTSEETCITILFVDCAPYKTPVYQCVGDRPFVLSDEDYRDLKTIIKLIEENYDGEV